MQIFDQSIIPLRKHAEVDDRGTVIVKSNIAISARSAAAVPLQACFPPPD